MYGFYANVHVTKIGTAADKKRQFHIEQSSLSQQAYHPESPA